jgi:hypothetical protein
VITASLQHPKRQLASVDTLLAALSLDDSERAALRARARTYDEDCGCAMGATFLILALILVPSYLATSGSSGWQTAVAGVAVLVTAPIAGKLTGLMLARTRLALLRRSLASRVGRSAHGHLH